MSALKKGIAAGQRSRNMNKTNRECTQIDANKSPFIRVYLRPFAVHLLSSFVFFAFFRGYSYSRLFAVRFSS
jgi:hypothetical protein